MADDHQTLTARSADSYQPSSVHADDDGSWTVTFAANKQFGEELALIRAAAWLAHHREHTLRELSVSWGGEDDRDELDASVQLVVIAHMNNSHFPALPCTASPSRRAGSSTP